MACVPRWLSAGAWPGRRSRTRCQAEAAAWCCPRMDSSSAWDIRPAIASGEGWFTTESLQVLAWLPLLYVSGQAADRSEEHTSELQSLMRISYAVFCLKKKNIKTNTTSEHTCRPSE